MFRRSRDGLILDLRVTPKARREEVAGVKPRAGGGVELIVKVTAAPDRGKANDAVLGLLAKALSLPRARLSLIAGETSRHKSVLVSGNPQAVQAEIGPKLGEWADRECGNGEGD